MPSSVLWFALVLAAMLGAWYAGQAVTYMKDPWRRGIVIGAGVLLLCAWSALIRNPSVAVQLIPSPALARLEGVGAAPLFTFVLGVAWQMSTLRRQRALLAMGIFLGIAYFLQGGLWMMSPTPTNAFSTNTSRYCVRQTQDYSCVPAASATALRLLGLNADEAEMAQLTETRAGSGATLLRAFNGINERLKHTGIQARLLETDYDQLVRVEPPMITPMQYQATRLHMVTLIEVRPHMVIIADPQAGIEFLSRHEFEQHYRGQVIAFDGKASRVCTAQVLEQFPHINDPDLSALAER